jgi:hypothetical protein
VFSWKEIIRNSSGSITPNNFIHKIFFSKYFIEQYFHIMPYMPVDVDIDGTRVREEFSHESKARVHILEIGDRAFCPYIRIGRLLEDSRTRIDGYFCTSFDPSR